MTLQIGMKALKRTTTKVGRNNNHGFAFNFITSRDIVHCNSHISITLSFVFCDFYIFLKLCQENVEK